MGRWWRCLIPLTKERQHAEKLAQESNEDKYDTLAKVRESNETTYRLAVRVRDNHFSEGVKNAMRRKGLT